MAEATAAPRKKSKLLMTDINTTIYVQNSNDKYHECYFLFTLCDIAACFKPFELFSAK
ncbi:hypothetical protein FYL58_07610 [Klebsiella aerogenes]|nr:hypothetical protein [Klebsiella aerogenes]EIW9497439.1 hypothetical protein [Klebsiella aerogenes]OWP46542.1 hypothetical protein CEG88_00635 [Klebsiella aerogenes]